MKLFQRCYGILVGPLILSSVAFAETQTNYSATLTAFPGAEGFAAEITGGRGGEVYHVTNLNDAGPGSFRAGVEHTAGPRTIVFDVGGYIPLKGSLHLDNDLTIAGQTAPDEGIGLRDSSISLSGSHNIIIRYVRFRQGLVEHQDKKSALNIFRARDILLDHLSIQWGRWDTVDMNECTNVTIQNSIIGPGVAPQRFGCLCESENVSFIRNLWISNQSRNPKSKGRIQYVNNVIYNWGVTGYVGGHSAADHYADLINNYFIKGPSSNDSFVGQFKPTDHIYQTGNWADLNRDGELNGRPVVSADFGSQDAPTLVTAPTAIPRLSLMLDSAADAYQKIVSDAGCSLHRDAVDRRLIADLTSLGKRGQTIHDPVEMGGFGEIAGGPAPLDTDGDGMPDVWEAEHHSNPKAFDANELVTSGRTRLEEYLNSLALPLATVAK